MLHFLHIKVFGRPCCFDIQILYGNEAYRHCCYLCACLFFGCELTFLRKWNEPGFIINERSHIPKASDIYYAISERIRMLLVTTGCLGAIVPT